MQASAGGHPAAGNQPAVGIQPASTGSAAFDPRCAKCPLSNEPTPLQVLFSAHSPFAGHYSLQQRLLALAAPLGMIINFFVTPFFLIVPVVSVLWGVFPVDINHWFAIAVTAYYPVLLLIKYYGTSMRHVGCWNWVGRWGGSGGVLGMGAGWSGEVWRAGWQK